MKFVPFFNFDEPQLHDGEGVLEEELWRPNYLLRQFETALERMLESSHFTLEWLQLDDPRSLPPQSLVSFTTLLSTLVHHKEI